MNTTAKPPRVLPRRGGNNIKTYIQKLKAALKTRDEPHCNYLVEFDCTITELLNSESNLVNVPKKFKRNGLIFHIIEVINDNNEQLLVLKHWRNDKKIWAYSIEPVWLINNSTNEST